MTIDVNNNYDGRVYTKSELANGYNVPYKVFKRMLDNLSEIFKSGKRKYLYPKEIRAILKEYGTPDWNLMKIQKKVK